MPKGYFLRILPGKYEESLFSKRCYFTGRARHWELESLVFFARKDEGRDSIFGLGILRDIKNIKELSEEEKINCEREGWRWKLIFGDPLLRCPFPIL
ncbi:MAG: hypothetical protein QXX95_05270 [Nitrososphaerales archaeon]